jgi:hypothetical protein
MVTGGSIPSTATFAGAFAAKAAAIAVIALTESAATAATTAAATSGTFVVSTIDVEFSPVQIEAIDIFNSGISHFIGCIGNEGKTPEVTGIPVAGHIEVYNLSVRIKEIAHLIFGGVVRNIGYEQFHFNLSKSIKRSDAEAIRPFRPVQKVFGSESKWLNGRQYPVLHKDCGIAWFFTTIICEKPLFVKSEDSRVEECWAYGWSDAAPAG